MNRSRADAERVVNWCDSHLSGRRWRRACAPAPVGAGAGRGG